MATFLHDKEKDLNQTWTLTNENYDKDVLLATLLQKYGDVFCVEKNPELFRYYAEMWWKKYYRTFQKWFDAFDIPYSPLENYNRKEERVSKSSEEGNQYNRYNDVGNTTTARTTGNTQDGTRSHTEDTQADSAKSGQGNETGSLAGTGHKTAGSKETWNRDKTTDTASDVDTKVRQSNSNTNTSGRMIAQYDSDGHIIGYTIAAGTERATEHGVSAYDEGANNISTYSEGNYAPGSLDIIHGSMSDVGSLQTDTNVKTNNAAGANRVTEHENGTKNITANTEDTTSSEATTKNNNFNELGTEKQNVTGTEISHDKHSGTEDVSGSSNTHGDSQSKNEVSREGQDSAFIHGNIGVTTSQQMLEAEIKVQLFSIYDTIAELFVDENCVCIYTNKLQREGGCGLW